MSDNLQDVANAVEGINKAWDEQKKVFAEVEAEVKKFGAEMPETKAKLEKIEADMAKMQEVADAAVLAAKRRERTTTDANGNEIDLDAKAAKWAASSAKSFGYGAHTYSADEMKAYSIAMRKYLRNGDRVLGADEIKALSVGGDPDGGYVVNPDMSGRMIERVFETSPMRAYASVQTISTDTLEGIYDDDEMSYGWVGETGSRAETNTAQFGKWSIPVFEMYAKPKATQKLLDDAEINIEEWVARKIADKFARAESASFITGTGVEQPRGFLTYSDWATAGTYEKGAIEQFDTGVNGAFAAAPNGGDALKDVMFGLKAGYRANANWFMNRATTKAVSKLKDSDGSYIWSPGIAAGQPDTLLGYPVAPFEDMPDPATGSLSLAFADMREAYQIVDRAGIRTLRDPYTEKPFVIFYSTKRVGGDVVNFDAIKLLNFKA